MNARLRPGVARRLSPAVRRLVAPNPGLMTGPGTNTYLVGRSRVAVIDPGPDDAGHIDAILAAAGADRIHCIVLTHTHPDHWPAARGLQAHSGAPIVAAARPPRADGFDLHIDEVLGDGDRIEGDGWDLEVLHTPGHAPNHVCLLLGPERALFTGDHVLNGTTTVVSPDRGGDMAEYLASLERMRRIRGLDRLLPAHGDVLSDPYGILGAYLRHRRGRERQILRALTARSQRIPTIVQTLYPELTEGLVPVAHRQVHAHLLKLRNEGLVHGTSVRTHWHRA